MTPDDGQRLSHSSHWGAFTAHREGGQLVVEPHPGDPNPSPLLRNIAAQAGHPARVLKPMVRRGWLEDGPGPDRRRGRDEFVEMEWPEVLDLTAKELKRVYGTHGPEGVFGGSYGWSSAGRFHHAQSQVHRFLNVLGGYVRSVNSYSAGAAAVVLPRIFGTYEALRNVPWSEIAEVTEMAVCFGGMALKNSMVGGGGISRHTERGLMAQAAQRGAEFVLVGPLKDDLPVEAKARWIQIVPGTDAAMILGLCHTLAVEGLHDKDFLARCCEGYPVFEKYLLGQTDGQPKDAAWASRICKVPAEEIKALARRMVGKRVIVSTSQSIQRAEHGEQPLWAAATLAAMLGQLGLPGGGYIYGYGSIATIGKPSVSVAVPAFSQLRNSIETFIPVARIADMLLNPGVQYDYDGQKLTYADIRLVYWAGGNPFHHHQDINRLREAFARPDTVIVHESGWTASARHADIVLPATVTIEREDIGGTQNDNLLIAMKKLVEPLGEARDDYRIFADLASRLGKEAAFTEGRGVADWLRVLYERTRETLREKTGSAPTFEEFWERGEIELPTRPQNGGPLNRFREDPEGAPLKTPSGKIEIYSKTVAGFGYEDCPGHPVWLPPVDGAGSQRMKTFPLVIVSNQPATRLHSQLDYGAFSQESKIRGREPMRINPQDATARGIADGDIVRLFNDRGACLAGARVSEDVAPGVVQLSTGAWYDPDEPGADNPLCVHGNPNVLTRDAGTSKLSQGCTGQITLVEVERFTGNLPPIRAFIPPGIPAREA